jgi:hypothetical protein
LPFCLEFGCDMTSALMCLQCAAVSMPTLQGSQYVPQHFAQTRYAGDQEFRATMVLLMRQCAERCDNGLEERQFGGRKRSVAEL